MIRTLSVVLVIGWTASLLWAADKDAAKDSAAVEAAVQKGLKEGEAVALEMPPRDREAKPVEKAGAPNGKDTKPVRADKGGKKAAL